VPFKSHSIESVGQGLFFRFLASTCVLTITICFTILKRALRARGVATVHIDKDLSSDGSSDGMEDIIDDNSIAANEDNAWPLHYDMEIHSSRITCTVVENERVATENGSIYSVEEAFNHLRMLIS